MPELPEVETTRRGLVPWLDGRVLAAVEVSTKRLRFPLPADFAARLRGRRVVALDRRAKFLLLRLDDGHVVIVHLGMSGRVRVIPPAIDVPLERHDHVIFKTEDGATIRYNDARRFGFMDLVHEDDLDNHPMLRTLGPEPLGNGFNAEVLAAALNGRRTPIKAALLDQRTVAGLGNIYVCEALYWAGISPRRQAHTIGGQRAERLTTAIRRVLGEAIEAGGSSLRDFRHADGQLGYFQANFAVYDRAGVPCPRCRVADGNDCLVRRIVQSGRSTFYCPRHQR